MVRMTVAATLIGAFVIAGAPPSSQAQVVADVINVAGPAGVELTQVLDGVPAGVESVRSQGRERALFVALAILVCLTLVVAVIRGAAGRLQAIGDSDFGGFLSQSWVTSVIAFVIGIGAAASAYALDVSSTQAIYAAFAAALVAAVFASAGALIRPGEEEENTALRWLGAMSSGLIAGFLIISLVAASALALDPGLPSILAGWAEADEQPFLQAAFEDEVERLVLAVVVGTLFAALTVLLLRGVADSKRAATERRQLQQELRLLRELIEGQTREEGEPRE